MKKDLMQILACPLCKGDLTLTVDEEQGEEVVSGSLYCPKCQHAYPIIDTIPNLLPPDLQE
ncbi:MAG: methytransferase partner Trm112 [Chloroflexota bacterium]|nr:methytransferase partner Trm112 [Chloroflexota bacterium]